MFRLKAADGSHHLDRIRSYMHSNLNRYERRIRFDSLYLVVDVSMALSRKILPLEWLASMDYHSDCLICKEKKKRMGICEIRMALPWKNNVGSSCRPYGLAIGHDRFGGLWSLSNGGEQKRIFVRLLRKILHCTVVCSNCHRLRERNL